jgi:hypothetical protein
MTTRKSKVAEIKKFIYKQYEANILKLAALILPFVLSALITMQALSQDKKDSIASGINAYEEMLNYSRPGKYHQILADLVGTWTFNGKHFDWTDSLKSKVALEFSGTVVRKSFANGRYFIVDVISDSTLEMPIQDGKLKRVKFQGLEIEGYDNVKKKFVKTQIGNHFGSCIVVPEGVYDSTTNTITFDSETEFAPGMKIKDHMLYIILDQEHYKWEYYQEQNGKYRKATEINFTRNKG